MANPFYATLKAQKEERDHFMKLYSSGHFEPQSLMPYVMLSSPQDTKQTEYDKIEPTETDQVQITERQHDAAAGFDVFKHTRVDIDEAQMASMK